MKTVMSEENTKILKDWKDSQIKHLGLIFLYAKYESKISRVENFEQEYKVLSEDHDKLPDWKNELSEFLTSKNAAEAECKRLNDLVNWSIVNGEEYRRLIESFEEIGL